MTIHLITSAIIISFLLDIRSANVPVTGANKIAVVAIATFTPETSNGEFVNFITHNGKTSVTIELPIKEMQLAKKNTKNFIAPNTCAILF